MKKILWLLFFALAASAAENPHGLLFIGDEYTDSGNFPATPYTGGTAIWSTMLGNRFNLQISPSKKGGTNFAYAFATTGTPYFPGSHTLLDQGTSASNSSFNRDYPVFIFGGANDLLLQLTLPFSAAQSAGNIATVVQDLKAQHFKTLIVLNLFDVGKFPANSIPSSTLTQQSIQFNQQLLQQVPNDTLIIDVFSLFNALLGNPGAYGFTNVTTPATNPVNFQGDLFWFQIAFIYPMTLDFHIILSDYVYSILQGANNYSVLAEQPHTLLRAETALLRQQLFPVQDCRNLYTPYFFVSGTYLPEGEPAVAVKNRKAISRGGDFLVGVTDRVSDLWTVGAAAGMQFEKWKSRIQGFGCEFKTQSEVFSLFSSLAAPSGYLNTYGTFDLIQYPEFRRTFTTGPLLHHSEGNTSGFAWGAIMEGAYLPIGKSRSFKTGPYCQIAYQQVHVSGFTEKKGDIGNLKYLSQSTKSLISGLGWDMRFHRAFSKWNLTSDFLLSFNRQWLLNRRRIHFQEASLASGPQGVWPIGRNDIWFGSGAFNFAAGFPNGSSFTFGYTLNFGGHHMRESLFSLSFAIPPARNKF